MERHTMRALPKARLMLFLVTTTPRRLGAFNANELELLMEFKDHALSGVGIYCASELEARHLLDSAIDNKGQVQANTIVSYPTIMFAEIIHLYARRGLLVAVLKNSYPSRTPRKARVMDERYYFLFDIQLATYTDLLSKIHGSNK